MVLGLAGGLVNLLTDLQWFSALGLSSVLTTRLWAQVGLNKDSLRALQGNKFRVLDWNPHRAHGANCP